jgi:peptidoglycan hydrolase-like protein with peptidoglycan-binding domain
MESARLEAVLPEFLSCRLIDEDDAQRFHLLRQTQQLFAGGLFFRMQLQYYQNSKENIMANTGPVLQNGSSGDDVKRLQRLLVMMKMMDFEGIDGLFGPKTEKAAKDFQTLKGLTVDGIVGPQTWGSLPADPNTPLLERGAAGPTVAALQQGLKKYNPVTGASTDPGPIDSDFGPKTENAVRAYQGERGVVVDGIVGDHTWWVPAGGAGATLASLAGVTTV